MNELILWASLEGAIGDERRELLYNICTEISRLLEHRVPLRDKVVVVIPTAWKIGQDW
jgi:hypothetical protein